MSSGQNQPPQGPPPPPGNDPGADENAAGKFALIEVPNFDGQPDPSAGMTSYLRLGAAPNDWKAWEKSKSPKGQKLAEEIYLSGPPGGHLNPVPPEGDPQIGTSPPEDRSPDHPFIDDARDRGDCPDPHGLSLAERLAESKKLHTKGGWRDHSDGNRITTTYGDKIEVIRGNYKMVVLGRQDDPSSVSGWDASGQHIQDFGYTMPGASVRVEWIQDYEGVWHLENSTENVRQSSRNAGTFRTENWGELMETITGSPNAAAMADFYMEDGLPRGNPKIYERTWAKKIETSTGSVELPVPTIDDSTWAGAMTSYTSAVSSSETTILTDALTSSTTAKSISDSTTAETITSTTTATTITETTTSGTTTETTTVGASTSTSAIGALTEIGAYGNKMAIEAAGVSTDISATGAATSISATGVDVELSIKALQAHINIAVIDITIAASIALDVHLGAKVTVDWPGKYHVTGTELQTAITKKIVGFLFFGF